jgi:hypothetical protein
MKFIKIYEKKTLKNQNNVKLFKLTLVLFVNNDHPKQPKKLF